MKILNSQYRIDQLAAYRSTQKNQTTAGTTGADSSSKYDSVVISSQARPSAEKTFQEHLSSRISMEVKQNAPAQKIDDLKNQIQSGSYVVDAGLIADKLLL